MRLSNAEIRELANDELRDYDAYLRRVGSHERGGPAERRRIAAELRRRNIAPAGTGVDVIADVDDINLLLADDGELERMLAESDAQLEEILKTDWPF